MRPKHDFKYMIKDYGVPYELIITTEGQYVNGDYIKGVELPPEVRTGIILNLGREDLQYAPNGTYTSKDIKIYETGILPTGAIVKYKGVSYKVDEPDLWTEYTDLNIFVCKKVANK